VGQTWGAEETLRKLLARHPLAGKTPVYAVDASVWPRCDSETSPQRGYYYHPSRHSAGRPIVAGWAYQFVARLNFVRESWTAPVDVERLRPAQDANEVAAQQIEALLGRLEEGEAVPLFVFDAGYDPVKVQRALQGSAYQILVRLRAGRRFYGDPSLCDPPEHIGRPRRHGPKMKCSDPVTWPEPSAEHRCEDAGYGPCALERGRRCTRRSRTTRDEALADPCPSWSARLSWSRSSGCPAKPPKPCGRSPSRPKGRLSGRAKRYPAIKRLPEYAKRTNAGGLAMYIKLIAKPQRLKRKLRKNCGYYSPL
jgi:hypothetical protein